MESSKVPRAGSISGRGHSAGAAPSNISCPVPGVEVAEVGVDMGGVRAGVQGSSEAQDDLSPWCTTYRYLEAELPSSPSSSGRGGSKDQDQGSLVRLVEGWPTKCRAWPVCIAWVHSPGPLDSWVTMLQTLSTSRMS